MPTWTKLIIVVSVFVSVHCGDKLTMYKQNANTRYTNISQTVSAGSALSCGRQCYNQECKIFNYNSVALMCELGSLAPGDDVQTDMASGWHMYFNAVDECESSPCQHSGTCTDHIGYYECSCLSAWGGTNCETIVGCLVEWQSFENSCYYFDKTDRKQGDAKTNCRNMMPVAHLADIKSEDEQNFVVNYVKASSADSTYFIDGEYNTTSGKYELTDGSSIDDWYTLWGPNEPNLSTDICLAVWYAYDYKWTDFTCDTPIFSVCEYEMP